MNVSAKEGYNREELRQFKEILGAMRLEALNDLRDLQESAESSGGNKESVQSHNLGSSFMEQSFDSTTREQNAFLMRRQSKLLGYLDAALKRIDESKYGICITCTGLIEKGRLEIVPHTQLCIACKNGWKR
jgi:RNA polymerase-binding transcription factor DksA